MSVVLAFFPHGPRRRKWIVAAIAFAFAMAFSRVYLGVHWLSDVETGVLLGTSVALLTFALVDEIRHRRFAEVLSTLLRSARWLPRADAARPAVWP